VSRSEDDLDRMVREACESLTDPEGDARRMARFRESCARMDTDPEYAARIKRMADEALQEPVRALTIKQPWAFFVAHCGKSCENRPRQMRYRGPLAIHAGAYSGWDRAAESDLTALAAWREYATVPATGRLAAPLTRANAFPYFTFGAVIAMAVATGCHHSDECMLPEHLVPPGGYTGCSRWAVRGQWHIELADVRTLPEPVPCRGALGLWHLPPEAEQAVRDQLEATQ
jgi:hypothetical protein